MEHGISTALVKVSNGMTNSHISVNLDQKASSKVVLVYLFCCFTSQSTAMVMGGRSVHLTTLYFLGKLEQAINQ